MTIFTLGLAAPEPRPVAAICRADITPIPAQTPEQHSTVEFADGTCEAESALSMLRHIFGDLSDPSFAIERRLTS